MLSTREVLILKTVPQRTDTYAPIANRVFLDVIDEELYKRGMVIRHESFNTDRSLDKVIGYFDIKHKDSEEIGMRLAFRNSYDKSMSAAVVSGNNVWICGNGCISGEYGFIRKHTGTALTEVKESVVKSIETLEDKFAKMLFQIERMKAIEVSKLEASELYGRLFMYDRLLNTNQMSIIKAELEDSSFESFKEDNLWSMYNHATYALKETHPSHYIDRHIGFHTKIEEIYSL